VNTNTFQPTLIAARMSHMRQRFAGARCVGIAWGVGILVVWPLIGSGNVTTFDVPCCDR